MKPKIKPKTKTSGTQTVFWWVVWISLTIGSFFVAAAVWTPFIAKHFGSIQQTRNAVIWVAAVFGTMTGLAKIVYVLVGISGIILLLSLFMPCPGCKKSA